jgi:DNA-binding response OmpR family regulator
MDGLMIARDTQPDLLILDWMLPGISGLNIG